MPNSAMQPREAEPVTVLMRKTKTQAEIGFAEQFASLGGSLPGGAELKALRRAAIDRFDELGLPHRRIEEWKYTDLRSKMTRAFPPPPPGPVDLSAEALSRGLGPLDAIDATRLVFVDGRYVAALSDAPVEDAVHVRSLARSIEDGDARAIGALCDADADLSDAILALNTAFMSDGAVVDVTGQAGRPIHLVFAQSGADEAGIAMRNVVQVADGAEVTLIESHICLGPAPTQRNVVTQLSAGDGARVDHLKVQCEGADATHLSNWLIRLGKGSDYRGFHFSSGAALARNQVTLRFDGEDASANVSGAFMLRRKQHNDTTLLVDHAEPGCRSRELFKGVVDDTARGVFQGRIVVQPHAQKTDGQQMAQALLLSERAEFDSKPELEIFADDVACGHGATTGQIDEEQLFYLKARCIPDDVARALLVQAFIGEAIETVEQEEVAEALSELTARWFAERNQG